MITARIMEWVGARTTWRAVPSSDSIQFERIEHPGDHSIQDTPITRTSSLQLCSEKEEGWTLFVQEDQLVARMEKTDTVVPLIPPDRSPIHSPPRTPPQSSPPLSPRCQILPKKTHNHRIFRQYVPSRHIYT